MCHHLHQQQFHNYTKLEHKGTLPAHPSSASLSSSSSPFRFSALMMVGRGTRSICCRTGRVGRDRLSLFSFLQENTELVKNSKQKIKECRAKFVTLNQSFSTMHLYTMHQSFSPCPAVSSPCLPGTHFLELKRSELQPLQSRITHQFPCPPALQTNNAYSLATFQLLCSWSKALLLWVKNRFPLWCLQLHTCNCIPGPNSCLV